MNSDGSDLHLLYPPQGTTGISATRPDWSWNANIAFAVNGEVIYTIHPDGTGAAPYYQGDLPLPSGMIYPSWDRDGESLIAVRYYQEGGAQQAELYRLRLLTYERLTTSPHPVAGRPSVSPDGRKIAFAGNEGAFNQQNNQIWIVEPPDAPFRLEPGDPVLHQGRSPNWSPDGTQIVFESTRPSQGTTDIRPLTIWVIDSDGQNPRQLTDNTGFMTSHPEWSRQQTRIVLNGPGNGRGIGIIDLTAAE
jgi:Tol biopolymer transport system component